MRYTIADIVYAFLLGVILAACTMAILIVDARQNAAERGRTCVAPCTVVLPSNTLEDEFGINYGWEDSSTPVVDVYTR